MMRQLAILVMLSVLYFLPPVFALPDEAVGRVVSVVSGDSLGIEMLIGDARTKDIDSIKLADIEAPSTVTAEGKASQKYALSLLKNKMVYLDIDNNTTRNVWSQLICVIYLLDSDFRPVWPPVNRILVEEGYAKQNDDPNNEFDPSIWWKPPPVFPPGEKSAQLKAMLEEAQQAEENAFAKQSSNSSLIGSSRSSFVIGGSNKGGVLEKDSTSGRVSIGYRK
jgi:endonuclease YncB( thermonuclease family)